jgi:DNA-binding transcriptional ArsR family regulator
MAHPLRVKILGELSQRIMSVKQFADVFPKYSYSQIYGHFRKLRELGFIELVEIKSGGRRRSAKEQFYRATERAFFDQTAWAALPASIRRGATAETLSNYIARVSEAIKIDTMDARPDRHVSWTDGHYDEQAWDETIRDLKEFLERIPRRQAEASTRLAESGEEPIRVTIGLSCFESPKASATDA